MDLVVLSPEEEPCFLAIIPLEIREGFIYPLFDIVRMITFYGTCRLFSAEIDRYVYATERQVLMKKAQEMVDTAEPGKFSQKNQQLLLDKIATIPMPQLFMRMAQVPFLMALYGTNLSPGLFPTVFTLDQIRQMRRCLPTAPATGLSQFDAALAKGQLAKRSAAEGRALLEFVETNGLVDYCLGPERRVMHLRDLCLRQSTPGSLWDTTFQINMCAHFNIVVSSGNLDLLLQCFPPYAIIWRRVGMAEIMCSIASGSLDMFYTILSHCHTGFTGVSLLELMSVATDTLSIFNAICAEFKTQMRSLPVDTLVQEVLNPTWITGSPSIWSAILENALRAAYRDGITQWQVHVLNGWLVTSLTTGKWTDAAMNWLQANSILTQNLVFAYVKPTLSTVISQAWGPDAPYSPEEAVDKCDCPAHHLARDLMAKGFTDLRILPNLQPQPQQPIDRDQPIPRIVPVEHQPQRQNGQAGRGAFNRQFWYQAAGFARQVAPAPPRAQPMQRGAGAGHQMIPAGEEMMWAPVAIPNRGPLPARDPMDMLARIGNIRDAPAVAIPPRDQAPLPPGHRMGLDGQMVIYPRFVPRPPSPPGDGMDIDFPADDDI